MYCRDRISDLKFQRSHQLTKVADVVSMSLKKTEITGSTPDSSISAMNAEVASADIFLSSWRRKKVLLIISRTLWIDTNIGGECQSEKLKTYSGTAHLRVSFPTRLVAMKTAHSTDTAASRWSTRIQLITTEERFSCSSPRTLYILSMKPEKFLEDTLQIFEKGRVAEAHAELTMDTRISWCLLKRGSRVKYVWTHEIFMSSIWLKDNQVYMFLMHVTLVQPRSFYKVKVVRSYTDYFYRELESCLR